MGLEILAGRIVAPRFGSSIYTWGSTIGVFLAALMILDAYRKGKVPFHLTTKEFMQLASSKLDENGILFANVISAPGGPGSRFYRAEYKTMAQVFPVVYSFPTSRTGVV